MSVLRTVSAICAAGNVSVLVEYDDAPAVAFVLAGDTARAMLAAINAGGLGKGPGWNSLVTADGGTVVLTIYGPGGLEGGWIAPAFIGGAAPAFLQILTVAAEIADGTGNIGGVVAGFLRASAPDWTVG